MPRPDRSRAALVESAATLFRRQGYAATGVAAILDCAGAKAGSLYYHFPDGKEELAAAVVESVAAQIRQQLDALLSQGASATDVLDGWFDLMRTALTSDVRDGCPIEPLATESVHASPKVRQASAAAFRGWCDVLGQLLLSGGWSKDDADRTATALIALIEGALMLSRVAGDTVALDAAQAAAHTLLERGRG